MSETLSLSKCKSLLILSDSQVTIAAIAKAGKARTQKNKRAEGGGEPDIEKMQERQVRSLHRMGEEPIGIKENEVADEEAKKADQRAIGRRLFVYSLVFIVLRAFSPRVLPFEYSSNGNHSYLLPASENVKRMS